MCIRDRFKAINGDEQTPYWVAKEGEAPKTINRNKILEIILENPGDLKTDFADGEDEYFKYGSPEFAELAPRQSLLQALANGDWQTGKPEIKKMAKYKISKAGQIKSIGEVYVAYYPENPEYIPHYYNHPNKDKKQEAISEGLIVFTKTATGTKIIWEDGYYTEGGVDLNFIDIDNDGSDEFTVDGFLGKHSTFDIYKWNGAEFENIHGGNGGLEDIDNDGILEVDESYHTHYGDYYKYLIYKFNGSEYFKWIDRSYPKTWKYELREKTHPGQGETHPPTGKGEPEPKLETGYKGKDSRIGHLRWAYANNRPYPSDSFYKNSSAEYVATTYNGSPRGILLFRIENNIPFLVWESEQFDDATSSVTGFLDVTGDGNKEMLVTWHDFVGFEELHIYEHLGGHTFRLISSASGEAMFLSRKDKIKLTDFDGDDIPEIWFPNSWRADQTGLDFTKPESYVTYKWNGEEYELWKEQATPFIK